MTVHHQDDWLTIHAGDCRDVLATMPERSVHMVCTSPPYWGLRDYGTATWNGGDAACNHVSPRMDRGDRPRSGLTGGLDTVRAADRGGGIYRDCCGKCGAIRQDAQLGLEPTPDEYVTNMVAVFREVRRVLRDDGTLWLNLGDSYNSAASNQNGSGLDGVTRGGNAERGRNRNVYPDLKPKDLVGIPWRVAFALQADGWYLRSDIIWAKPNPMPESVTDRPTKSHEYLFLLTKSPTYYFDADAVREEGTGETWDSAKGFSATGKRGDAGHSFFTGEATHHTGPQTGRNIRSVWYDGGTADDGLLPASEPWRPSHTGECCGCVSVMQQQQEGADRGGVDRGGMTDLWTIATAPYKGSHFATFPPKLVEPCIKAGTSERGVCPDCGAPWRRVVTRESNWQQRKAAGATAGSAVVGHNSSHGKGMTHDLDSLRRETTGWKPTCAHDKPPVPATVLDIFGGSGTTAMVAQALSRRAILIDLNVEYLDQQLRRNAAMPLGLGAA